MKVVHLILMSVLFFWSSLGAAHATGIQSWSKFIETENGTLQGSIVFPRGFTVDAGTQFQLLQNYPLEGLGVEFILLQADHCSDMTHLEEMIILKPEASVGITWDPNCQMEVYIETLDLGTQSLFFFN